MGLIKKIVDLYGLVTEENIKTIQKYTRLASQKSKKTIGVDIGTLNGQSAIAMATALDNIEVYTIDPNISPLLFEQLKQMGVKDKVHFYNMASAEFSLECPEQIDICFIDGRHDYFGVKSDIDNISPKIRPGGYILFHDYNLYFNTIKKAVDENIDKLYEFIEEVGGVADERNRQGSIWVGRMF